jgi:hypothetical protein
LLGAARHRDVLAEEAGPVFARAHLQCVPLDAVRDVVEYDRGVVLFAPGGLVEGCEAVEAVDVEERVDEDGGTL